MKWHSVRKLSDLGSDDIDLDRTINQLVEHPVPEEDDIVVRERVRTRRSVVLLADVSGSMRGAHRGGRRTAAPAPRLHRRRPGAECDSH